MTMIILPNVRRNDPGPDTCDRPFKSALCWVLSGQRAASTFAARKFSPSFKHILLFCIRRGWMKFIWPKSTRPDSGRPSPVLSADLHPAYQCEARPESWGSGSEGFEDKVIWSKSNRPDSGRPSPVLSADPHPAYQCEARPESWGSGSEGFEDKVIWSKSNRPDSGRPSPVLSADPHPPYQCHD